MSLLPRPLNIAVFIAILALPPAANAGDGDTGANHRPLRTVNIDTETGTWMSIDASPDGGTLVFDLLGDIYLVSNAGGAARRLTDTSPSASSPHGLAFDSQPRFSPDGARIAFISDRSGSDNLWVMNSDGSSPRRVSDEHGVILNSPAWSPEGGAVVCRRSESSRSGELWLYALDGADEQASTRLTRADELIDAQGPVFSADGEHVYFSAPFGAGGGRRALRRESWQIGRVHLTSGEIRRLTERDGGAVRPLISPDGHSMAYAGWRDHEPALLLSDVEGDGERVVLRGVERTLQDMFLTRMDLFPGYAFDPAGASIYASVDGRIRRVSLRDGDQQRVPFRVRTEVWLPEAPQVRAEIGEEFESRMPRWAVVDEARDQIIFEAIGRLWRRDLGDPQSRPHSLTPATMHATQPSLSPDGRWVAFVASMDPDDSEHLYRVPAAGGDAERLTTEAKDYARPMWSPDGGRIVLLSAEVNDRALAQRFIPERQIAWIDSTGGEPHPIAERRVSDAGARFGPNGERVWYTVGGQLRSISLDRRKERTHLTVPGARQVVPSPDGERLAVAMGHRIFVRPLESDGDAALKEIGSGYFPDWSEHGALTWTFGGDVLVSAMSDDAGAVPASDVRPRRFDVRVRTSAPGPSPQEAVALTRARLIPMSGQGVIEEGTIVVRGRRIEAVGPSGEVDIPGDATILDVSGRTIIPGLIDAHQHALALLGADELRSPRPDFAPASVLLAFGVTTTRDPALLSNVRDVSMIELINSGRALGPRFFFTGERLRPQEYPIDDLPDAQQAVETQRSLGASYIKEYLQPDRRARRLISDAAYAQRIAVTAEGGFDYKHSVTAIFDGYTGVEHSAGNHPIRDDFAQLVAASGTFYVPTVLTQIGAEHYFRRSDVPNNEKLRSFISEAALRMLVARPRRGQGIDERETAFVPLIENVARLVQAGAIVGVGAHDMPAPTGLGTHWEMWSFVRGGVPPMRALESATREGAVIIGVEDEVGTLEPGKLADFLVLRANPLDDIRNTTDIEYVVQSGVIRSGETLSRGWPESDPNE